MYCMTPDTLLDVTPSSDPQKITMMYRRKQSNFRNRISRRLHSRLVSLLDFTVNKFQCHASQFPKTYIRPWFASPFIIKKMEKKYTAHYRQVSSLYLDIISFTQLQPRKPDQILKTGQSSHARSKIML